MLLEGAAGGSAFAIGFEAVKFIIGQVAAEFRRAAEELKAFTAIQTLATGAIMEGKYALDKLTAAKGTEGDKAFRDTFDAATKGAKELTEEVEKMREKGPGVVAWVRAAFGDGDLLQEFEDTIAAAAGNLDRVVASAKEYAGYARDFAGGFEESPAQDKRYWEIKADDAVKAKTERDKRQADSLKLVYENLANEMQRLADEEDRAVTVQAERLKTIDKELLGEKNAAFPMFGPGNDIGAADFEGKAKEIQALNKEAAMTQDIFASLGASVGSAFGAMGEAVGGAAGTILKVIGAMITQAISLAIAMTMASVAWTTPLGMVAIGAIALAGITALIASVPSYEVGTPYVPRTGMAMLHQGERVVPAAQNAAGFGGSSITVNISATDAGSFEKMLRRNDNALVRVLRDSQRAGRG